MKTFIEHASYILAESRKTLPFCHTHLCHLLYLARQNAEIYIIAVEGIIMRHSVTTEQVQKHRRHTPHTDFLLSARQIEAVGLLLQVFPCDELRRQVHGVTLHQPVALDGSQHGIDPTELARPLVLHGGGLDQAFRLWLLQYLLHLSFAVAGR